MPAKLFETFYRVGSTIFGGGQVVLPMLLTHVVEPPGGKQGGVAATTWSPQVEPGWVSEEAFYAGLALTQSLPGPLFNFSASRGGAGSRLDATPPRPRRVYAVRSRRRRGRDRPGRVAAAVAPCPRRDDAPPDRYLGTVAAGLSGGLASVAGLFGPGCVLILATSPFWLAIRRPPGGRRREPRGRGARE